MSLLIHLATLAGLAYVIYLLRYKVMPKQSEVAAGINQANEQIGKVHAEVQQLKTDFEALREAYDAEEGEASPEVVEALSSLQSRLNTLDELLPDSPSNPTPAGEGTQS